MLSSSLGPFHAGGAHVFSAERWSQASLADAAAAFLRRFWTTTHATDLNLNLTQAGSLIAIAGAAPAAWRLLRGAWIEVVAWARRFFVASVTIPARDPLNRDVVRWVIAHVVETRGGTRFFTAHTAEAGSSSSIGDDHQFHHHHHQQHSLPRKRSRRAIQYCAHWRSVWFWHSDSSSSGGGSSITSRGALVCVSRAPENLAAVFSADPSYDGIGGAELTISCLGRSAGPARAFIETCRAWAERRAQHCVVVYARDRYGVAWQARARRAARRLDTVHFDERCKAELLADVRTYLAPGTLRRYRRRSMPYRRGYLFYGPPGTGKTSLTTALAGEFGLDLYEVQIPSVPSDADLEQMFREIPPQCIVLLEDIDAVWSGREQYQQQQQQQQQQHRGSHHHDNYDGLLPNGDGMVGSGHQHHADNLGRGSGASAAMPSNCTLSGLLNVLDGVGSQEGRIVIMTTNRPERLDDALVRPGRVDMKVFLGNISRASARQMFVRMFAPEEFVVGDDASSEAVEAEMQRVRGLSAEFAKEVPEDTFTPSQLQGFFQMHLDSPDEAVNEIGAWVRRELGKKSDRDFEFVPNDKRM